MVCQSAEMTDSIEDSEEQTKPSATMIMFKIFGALGR